MKIFFDLDGTLIDSRQRLYQLFQHLVPASVLPFDAYWNYKRNKISHKEILLHQFKYTKEQIELFDEAWMKKIELAEWLALDKPFEGVTDFLAELQKKYRLFLVTARQSETMAIQQIEQFGWGQIFEKVFVTAQKKEKYELISSGEVVSNHDWFVGDTGKDIETGKQLGAKTAAVLSGFLNTEKLLEYEPDVIINTIIDFKPEKNMYE
jgi:phosphoglycolate phosphatase